MQKFKTEIVELKNKKFVTIRQAEIDDAERLLNCIKTYVPQSAYIPKLEQEIKLTIEQEKEWINSFLTNENEVIKSITINKYFFILDFLVNLY